MSAAADAAAEVTAALEAYRFNEAAGAAYRFVWNLFCDWYLEFAKPVLQGDDTPEKAETQATTAFVLDTVCRLLHPFMPFITEELWAIKGAEGPARESVLALASWPDLAAYRHAEAAAEVDWVIDLVSQVRSVRSDLNVPGGALVPLVLAEGDARARERIARWSETLKRLARLSDIILADAAPRRSVQVPVAGGIAALPLEQFIDLAVESRRIGREIARLDADAGKLEAKLSNTGFLAKASDDVIEETRERVAEMRSRLAKLQTALAQLTAGSGDAPSLA